MTNNCLNCGAQRIDGFCKPCLVQAELLHKSELYRQEIGDPRRTMLERLKQFVRKSQPDEAKVRYFESRDPLAKYLS